MLSSLVDLARQTSSESRRGVLLALTRLLVDGAAAHSDRELALFGEILIRLMDQVAEEDRVQLARTVARQANTPHDLAVKLAYDEAPVAAPILEFSPVLTAADLVGIANSASQTHLLSIARRAGIVEPISDAIVGRAELLVLDTLTRNLSAKISSHALNQLGLRALVDPLLGDALSLRPDLPANIARKIMAVLPPEARQRIELQLNQSGDRLNDLMGRAIQLLDPTRPETNHHRGEVRRMLLDIRSGHRTVDDTVDELVFQKRLADIASLLADLVGVPETHVSSALHKLNATGIGVICRTLGLSDVTFRRLSCLRCEKLRLPFSQAEQMLRDFKGISPEMAEKSIRYHRISDAPAGFRRA